MKIAVETKLKYRSDGPCDVLLQIEAADTAGQTCERDSLRFKHGDVASTLEGEEQIGQRRWVRISDELDCTYSAEISIERTAVNLEACQATPLPALPSDAVKFLMPSRYCRPTSFLQFVSDEFEGLSGGALVSAVSSWIFDSFTYDGAASTASTDATDSFKARAGVCRDYAHVLIAMARAAGIPARLVSAYAPDVDPPDFHAVAEVFLDGQWHLVDPTGMSTAADIVKIGVGRDAADASFITSYGAITLSEQSVHVSRIE